MYANLIEKRTFAVELADRTLEDCEIESEWNGLAKVVQPSSGLHLIILREEGLVVDGSKSLIDSLLEPAADPLYVTIPRRVIKVGSYNIDVPAFRIPVYNNCIDTDGNAYVSATEKPAVSIDYKTMRQACKNAGGDLMRGSQHLALAMDIMSVDANWSGGKVGQGILKRGLHRGTVSGAQPGTYVSPHADEDRWFTLLDGQRICDAAGHLFGALVDDIHGTSDGLAGKIPADSPYLVIGQEFSQAQGIGWRPDGTIDWSGHALVRGGCWRSGGRAGLFRLYRWHPRDGIGGVGFRCTLPIQTSGTGSQVAA